MEKKAIIYGGGTVFHVRPHLALSAPAYGSTAKYMYHKLQHDWNCELQLTKMAGGRNLETNEDVKQDINKKLQDTKVKLIVMSAALCDFTGNINFGNWETKSGKDQPRLDSSFPDSYSLDLKPDVKIIQSIRKTRKDIFLVGFKTTTNDPREMMIGKGLNLLKKSSCNLVLVNDIQRRINLIVTPEMAVYGENTERGDTLNLLADMINARSGLTFNRTTLGESSMLEWEKAPNSLKEVVDYCIGGYAYKPFLGVTVGHFGFRDGNNVFYSSRRKKNYNNIQDRDLVKVEFNNGKVIAGGEKPSAGVTSQYAILSGEYDCVVHFHCPLKQNHKDNIQQRPQIKFECGSAECGQNTLSGLTEVRPGIRAVMLERHGPNIIFNRNVDPQNVISFINDNFDLGKQAGIDD